MTSCKEKLSIDSILNIYQKGCKTEEFLGLEYERLPVNKYTKETISYYGDFGVCEVLKEFARIDNWDYILDDNEIIGLKKIHDTITLEPGAQVELSIEPQKNVTDLKNRIDEINSSLEEVFDKYNISLMNYGVYPKTTYKNIRLIPKQRYHYMENYLWGILSDVMMRETAGIQVGIDFRDEEDAMRKFNLANKISPFITAMYTNSSIRGGVDTGYKSFRALAWLNTDNERCGFATKFKQDMSFMDYINSVFEVPMIFIVRDNKYIYIDGKINFKTFWQNGYDGYEATLEDFLLQANLFFPEIRLRNFIEIRNHDCVDEKYMYSLVSLYKGIFYNSNAIMQVEKLLEKITYNDISEIRYNVPRFGLDTVVKGNCIKDISKDILKIAEESLKIKGDSDLKYIYPIKELTEKGLTPLDVC